MGVRLLQERSDLVEPHVVFGERLRIDFDANRGQRTPADTDLPHPLNLRQLLREYRRCNVVELRPRHHIGFERHQKNRHLGRVVFPVSRELRKIGGKESRRSGDRRLHIARRRVDVAAQLELQGDLGAADGAARSHFGDSGNAGKLLLQRSRHGGRHHLGAGAGQIREHLYGGEVDLRKRRDGQEGIGNRARQRDRGQEQCRGNRSSMKGVEMLISPAYGQFGRKKLFAIAGAGTG